MEDIKRACALGGVSVQASPVETRTTHPVPFMQITERQDSRNVPRSNDHVGSTALKYKGEMDSLNEYMVRLIRILDKTIEQQNRKLDRDNRSSRDSRDSRDSRNSRDDRRSYRSDSDSSSEDDRHRSRSRDSSRSRSRSRGRSIITCTYCHKPNHDLSHCYKLTKYLKKLYSGEIKIDGSRDKDEQARLQMLTKQLNNKIEN